MVFLEELYNRRKKLADILSDDDYSGIREIVEELYPDKAHFIYELLQNAEDAGATEASFKLEEARLIFIHDGKPFLEQDIEAITNIGKGAKKAQEDKIGRFGIGFKSVFAYTENPHIWCSTFSFKLSNMVLPSQIEPKDDICNKTRFEFPFNSPKKQKTDAYAEIKSGLEDLAETTLLFLKNIEAVHWDINGEIVGDIIRISHEEHHIEILKHEQGTQTKSFHYLRFSQAVSELPKQHVSIAFDLELSDEEQPNSNKTSKKKRKIVPALPGKVAVYFPAEKESSGLRFHIHAPFVPELSRASVKDTPTNAPLFKQISELAASSLHKIKELGLLNTEFIGVLPNNSDTIHERYKPIRNAILEEMNKQALTPTYKGKGQTHAPAEILCEAKASLKALLTKKDLEALYSIDSIFRKETDWVESAPQRNSDADRFLKSLDILEIEEDEFAILFCNQFIKEKVKSWLSDKKNEWLQQLYAFLIENADDDRLECLRDSQIVRLKNGKYTAGSNCYFPSEDGSDGDFDIVAKEIYTSGKNKKEKDDAKRFLERVGVKEVGEQERIKAILEQRYSEEHEISNWNEHFRDLKLFKTFSEKPPYTHKEFFSEYNILVGENGRLQPPSKIYLDKPFCDTGLSAYYKALRDKTDCMPLSEKYFKDDKPIPGLLDFAKKVEVIDKLPLKKQHINHHILKWKPTDYWKRWTNSKIAEDWDIPELKTLLIHSTLPLSKLIWKRMSGSEPRILNAKFRPNKSYPIVENDSSLIITLKKAKWIPQKDGSFVSPADAIQELLPPGFPYDSGQQWLKAVGFGDNARKKSEEYQKRKLVIKDLLGTDDVETVELFKELLKSHPIEKIKSIFDEINRPPVELPEDESANPERRSMKILSEALNAPDRTTEERVRSVSKYRDEIKKSAIPELKSQYTNPDGIMICQICQEELPFKLKDGSYYFEAVEFLPELKNRHRQNYIALCPLCAAMFKHVNDTKDMIKELFLSLDDKHLEIVLAGKDEKIYFTTKHREDLKKVIEADSIMPDNETADKQVGDLEEEYEE